jgi:hypothetical protein
MCMKVVTGHLSSATLSKTFTSVRVAWRIFPTSLLIKVSWLEGNALGIKEGKALGSGLFHEKRK